MSSNRHFYFLLKRDKMHLNESDMPEGYLDYIWKKMIFLVGSSIFLIFAIAVSISVGAVNIPLSEVINVLIGNAPSSTWHTIIWNIRLPQALTGVAAGIGLSVAGVAMQSILRNPLGSPFTLGISNAGAFGAAFSVMVLDTGTMRSRSMDAIVINNPYTTTIVAFIFCLIATTFILGIARIKKASPEVMILAGVALSSLFTAGTMFLQFFADDVQLAAVVFWTFGDVARADWRELGIISFVVLLSVIYFFINRWNYNAIDAGDDTALGLGVNVERIRLIGMIVSSLVTAVIVAFLGVIGFVGLVCPHIVRNLIGDDNRFLIPGSILIGGVLLSISDTAARLVVAPHVLPVAILTAFMGAPVFIFLLVKGGRRK